jgi:2-oxoisovalerate dehydrogenase E1 component
MTFAASKVSPVDAVELYRRMARIRRFEERTAELYAAGAIPGFVHVSVGQEATAVGACWACEIPTASCLPIAVGVAAGFRQQGRDDVVVAFFGDGAIAHGTFHESLNLASLWRLPVLFLCENNQYAEFSATRRLSFCIGVSRCYGGP